jgi:hypothetical protein
LIRAAALRNESHTDQTEEPLTCYTASEFPIPFTEIFLYYHAAEAKEGGDATAEVASSHVAAASTCLAPAAWAHGVIVIHVQ